MRRDSNNGYVVRHLRFRDEIVMWFPRREISPIWVMKIDGFPAKFVGRNDKVNLRGRLWLFAGCDLELLRQSAFW
jgi:hypothetical protein